jgi:hypothetical protein
VNDLKKFQLNVDSFSPKNHVYEYLLRAYLAKGGQRAVREQ